MINAVLTAIIASFILLIVVLLTFPAKAADEAYCALYAREAVRIDIQHTTEIDKLTADTDYIMQMAVKVYGECLSILPTPLPLPPAHRHMDTWLADMRDLLLAQSAVEALGTESATGPGIDRAACARAYRTWRASDGTVLRRGGGGKRVPCPL